MTLIASKMWIWLILSIGLIVGMFFYHKRKTEGGSDNTVDFSNTTIFFDPFKGEGDVFLGGLLVLFFFSMFLWEFFGTIRSFFIK